MRADGVLLSVGRLAAGAAHMCKSINSFEIQPHTMSCMHATRLLTLLTKSSSGWLLVTPVRPQHDRIESYRSAWPTCYFEISK